MPRHCRQNWQSVSQVQVLLRLLLDQYSVPAYPLAVVVNGFDVVPFQLVDIANVEPGSQVDLKHVEHFISVIGAFEDQIFQKRARLLQRQKQRRERDKANSNRPQQPGQGQAGSKWKAAVPNASFTASLQSVGQNQSGNGSIGQVSM